MNMSNLAWQKNVNDLGEFNVLSEGKKNSILFCCHFKIPLIPVTVLHFSFTKSL